MNYSLIKKFMKKGKTKKEATNLAYPDKKKKKKK